MSIRSSGEIAVVPAQPQHCEAIAELIRAGIDSASGNRVGSKDQAVDLTIYGSQHIAKWIAAHLRLGERVSEREYTVALERERVVGCAELAPRRDSLFLSYISVLPSYQNRGVGSRLLGAAIRRARVVRPDEIQLDVSASNAAAEKWYVRLGFMIRSTNVLCEASGLLPQPRLAGQVFGAPAAEAAHTVYGFSELEIETEAGRTRVGRLGERWWRLTGEPRDTLNAMADSDLLATIRALDPRRGLLIGLPVEQSPPGSTELLRMRRLGAAVDRLLEQLPE